jgi:hypothetical protein
MPAGIGFFACATSKAGNKGRINCPTQAKGRLEWANRGHRFSRVCNIKSKGKIN